MKNHSIIVSDRENLAKLFQNLVDLCTQMPKTKLKAALKTATQEPKTTKPRAKAQPKPKTQPKEGLQLAERLPRGAGYRIHVEPLPPAAAGESPERNMNRSLETLIRGCPEQYLWSYNRYKVPAGVAAPETNAPATNAPV